MRGRAFVLGILAACEGNWKRFHARSLPMEIRAIRFAEGVIDRDSSMTFDSTIVSWSPQEPWIEKQAVPPLRSERENALNVQNLRCDRGGGQVGCAIHLIQAHDDPARWICVLNFTRPARRQQRADAIKIPCPLEIVLDD